MLILIEHNPQRRTYIQNGQILSESDRENTAGRSRRGPPALHGPINNPEIAIADVF